MSMRKPCGHNLLKKVVLSNGKTKYYPLKVYCYKKLKDSLFNLLNRPGMWQLCQHWKSRIVPPNSLADVYDGKVWKSFKGKDGSLFFKTASYNIGLMLNCDWFPPFDRTQYSVGVMYAVVLNLPRAIHFKPENLLIIGIIPGPDEPNLVMNSYLKPMTDEHFDLWEEVIHMQLSFVLLVIGQLLLRLEDFLVTLHHMLAHTAVRSFRTLKNVRKWIAQVSLHIQSANILITKNLVVCG